MKRGYIMTMLLLAAGTGGAPFFFPVNPVK